MADARLPWVLPIRQGTEVFDGSKGRTPAIVRITIGIKPNTPREMMPYLQERAQQIIEARQTQLIAFYQVALSSHGLGIVPISARTLNLQELQARYQNQNGTEILDITIYPDLAFTPQKGGGIKTPWTHLRVYCRIIGDREPYWKFVFKKPLKPPPPRHVYGLDPIPAGWPDMPQNDWLSTQNNILLAPIAVAAFDLEDDLKFIKRPPHFIPAMTAIFDITHLRGSFAFDIEAQYVVNAEGPLPDLNKTVEVFYWMIRVPKPTDWNAPLDDVQQSFEGRADRSAAKKIGTFTIASVLQNPGSGNPAFYGYPVEQPVCATASFDGIETLSIKVT